MRYLLFSEVFMLFSVYSLLLDSCSYTLVGLTPITNFCSDNMGSCIEIQSFPAWSYVLLSHQFLRVH